MRGNVSINKLNGALGRRAANTDAVFGMALTGVAVVGGAQLGTIYPLKSTRDAIAIGLTSEYDTANGVLVYHHIDRFFKRNSNGFLYLILAPQTAKLSDLVDPAQNYAKKLLRESGGKIKYLGVAINPDETYARVLATGLDADVFVAVTKAQSLYESEFDEFRYASILLEGRAFNGTAAAAMDLRTLASPQVSVTIAADPAISADFADYAAVGDILGIISLAAVSQDPGELIDRFNLSDPGREMFVTAGLSSAQSINTYTSADLDTLNDKGYIFPDVISGLDGFFISDSHTCSALVNNDFAYIEANRTIEKAIFLARTALLPRVKSRLKVDSTTGQLQDEDRKAIETIGNKSIEQMEDDGDISGNIDCYIDPEQDVLSTSMLNVELAFTPVSIARQIVLSIGFSNPFKS